MTNSEDAARRYREEAKTWAHVAQAMPDLRRRMYWQRLADDYAALAARLEVADPPAMREAAE